MEKSKKESSVNNLSIYSAFDISILKNSSSKNRLNNLLSIHNLAETFFAELNSKYCLCKNVNKQEIVEKSGYMLKIKNENDLIQYICEINILGEKASKLFLDDVIAPKILKKR